MWLGAGLLVALLATSHRQTLRTAGPWVASGLAALIFLPHVLWQVVFDWPTLEFVQAATTTKMVSVPPLDLFLQQALVWNPVALPVWLVGLVTLIRRQEDELGRVFAIVFATTAAILIVSGTSRPNYLALAVTRLEQEP